jgi:hypothetical protein
MVLNSELEMAEAFKKVADHHKDEPDIYYMCVMMAGWSEDHARKTEPFRAQYEADAEKAKEPERLSQSLFKSPRKGSLALLRDLHDLWLINKEIEISWMVLLQASRALRDIQLESLCTNLQAETKRQGDWLLTRIKQAAPQTLVVAE